MIKLFFSALIIFYKKIKYVSTIRGSERNETKWRLGPIGQKRH